MDLEDFQKNAKPLFLRYRLDYDRKGIKEKFVGWFRDKFSGKKFKDTHNQKCFSDKNKPDIGWEGLIAMVADCRRRGQQVMVIFDSFKQIPGKNQEDCEYALQRILNNLDEQSSIQFMREKCHITAHNSMRNAQYIFDEMDKNPRLFTDSTGYRGYADKLKQSIQEMKKAWGNDIIASKSIKPGIEIVPKGTFDKRKRTTARTSTRRRPQATNGPSREELNRLRNDTSGQRAKGIPVNRVGRDGKIRSI